jgi:hypothetical protein
MSTGSDVTQQDGGLTLAEGLRELLPEIGPRLGRLVGHQLRTDVISCGRHGCILYTVDGTHVVKITGDRSETLGWLYVQGQQNRGNEAFLAGAVHVEGIWRIGVGFPSYGGLFTIPRVFGVALLERVVPAHRKHHWGNDRSRLARAASTMVTRKVCEPIRRIDDALTRVYKALQDRKTRTLASMARSAHPALDGLLRMVRQASKDNVWFEDVELHNVGWRLETKPPTLVLFDLGRVWVNRSLRNRLQRKYKKLPIHELTRPFGDIWR